MNSYPAQFLAHPQPLMFVAGLTPSRDRSGSTSQSQNLNQAVGVSSRRGSTSKSRRPSDAGPASGSGSNSTFLDPSQSTSLNSITPITSPSLNGKHAELPQSPPPLASPSRSGSLSAPGASNEQSEKDRDFEKLVSDLRGALEVKGGPGKVWLTEKERKDFRIMLVDKYIRLPARKVAPPTANNPNDQPPPSHSPLSPLTPSSPTYPDGLITPMWVRKHAEFTPSVFVLFLRLWESSDPTITPEQLQEKEREMDDSLVKEIADRRRRLGERGIKLTVVLMASAAALDSPVLDPRLSYLRRASSLSAKASLFVLTPVPADQLPDFVQSLQDALYDSAIEYYAAHGKKVRRKRVRLPSVNSGAMSGVPGKTLGSQGWAVRYDWKAGWFAELRGDMVEARRHYEDCWNELAKMFGSTQTLPPRTKRWAEAKVLADCVAIRICRLLLYSTDAPKVLSPFHVHLKRFGDLSRGWGIGEETFEFWSSLARQYRIFAELLEMAQQDNLRIPLLAPPTLPTAAPPGVGVPTLEYFATPVSSMNAQQVLQQPAFYYYTAADCTMKRKARFDEALALEEDAKDSEAGGHIAMAPGFANEKKVDHSELAIELFTKAYQLLKEESLGHPRIALLVAFRIAETYCASSQHELAMRFFDRISPIFKEDRWSPIVRQIRDLWYKCAQSTGNVEIASKLLLEMMSPKSGSDGEDRAGLQEDFLSLLKTTQPSSSDPIVIMMDSDSAILNASTAFWAPQADLGGQIPFQISLSCDENVDISQLRFSAIQITFSDDRPDCLVKSDGTGDDESFLDIGVVYEEEIVRSTGDLRWSQGGRLVINGLLKSNQEDQIYIDSLKLSLSQNTWNFQLILPLVGQSSWYTPKAAISPVHELATSVNFIPRPMDVKLDANVEAGYVGEQIPIVVKVHNQDDRKVSLRLSVFLPPGDEVQDLTAKNEDQESTSLLQDISLGSLEPSSSAEKTIYIQAIYPGTKLIDLSIQVSLDDGMEGRVEEVNHTVEVIIDDPFDLASSVMYRHSSNPDQGAEGWATVMSLISVPGLRGMTIESIDIEAKDETVEVSTSLGQDFPQEWTPSTTFSIASKFAMRPSRRASTTILGPSTEPSGFIVIKWKANPSSSPSTTTLPLPTLSLPPQDSFITAHLSPPPSAHLNTPTPLSISITNSHPSATASQLSLSIDPSENFIWIGPKSIHIPALAPGSGWKGELEVIPTNQTGWLEMPKVRLWEGVGEDREELDIVIWSERGARVEIGGAGIMVLP